MDNFLAEIRIFPYDFAPANWALCNGQLMPISQNTALFALLGVTYGGDGRTTFALPNLQGAVPVGVGQAVSGTRWSLGQATGTSSYTLQQAEMPVHNHTLMASSTVGTQTTSTGAQIANGVVGSFRGGSSALIYSNGAPNAALNPQSIVPSGGNQPHNNMMPYLGFNFCIALRGIFPPRS